MARLVTSTVTLKLKFRVRFSPDSDEYTMTGPDRTFAARQIVLNEIRGALEDAITSVDDGALYDFEVIDS